MPLKKTGGHVGPLGGSTGGRADKLPVNVPEGSHVIPADVVAALGQGNSAHGYKVLSQMFPASGLQKRDGGEVPIMASDGEFIVSPAAVSARGKGDREFGHRAIDAFIIHTRKQNIENLKQLPGPSQN